MLIPFQLSGVFTANSNALENAHCLKALLDALIECNVAYLRHHSAPSLYGSGVVYGRTTEWERIPDVLRRGYADCKSLSSWRIAELRMKGIRCRSTFRFSRREGWLGGVPDFHILIQTQDGWECPSQKLGMNAPEESYFKR